MCASAHRWPQQCAGCQQELLFHWSHMGSTASRHTKWGTFRLQGRHMLLYLDGYAMLEYHGAFSVPCIHCKWCVGVGVNKPCGQGIVLALSKCDKNGTGLWRKIWHVIFTTLECNIQHNIKKQQRDNSSCLCSFLCGSFAVDEYTFLVLFSLSGFLYLMYEHWSMPQMYFTLKEFFVKLCKES